MANRIAVSPDSMATTISTSASMANRKADFIASLSALLVFSSESCSYVVLKRQGFWTARCEYGS